MRDVTNYIGLLFNRAAQKSVTLTDRLTILIVPFTTLVLWMTGAKMTESIQETLAMGVAITVMAVVILRFGAASYFVWKEDRAEIARLRANLNSSEFRESEAMNEHRLNLRKELGDRLAWLITYAESCAMVSDARIIFEDGERQFARNFSRAREIISQLSYDVILRVTCLNIVKLVTQIVNSGITDTDARGKSVTLERLWKQRKLTFKLLHRQDIHEIITLAEIENLISDHGENFGDNSLSDLRNLLKENPELAYSGRWIIPLKDEVTGKI